jgi:hypothetical protein
MTSRRGGEWARARGVGRGGPTGGRGDAAGGR